MRHTPRFVPLRSRVAAYPLSAPLPARVSRVSFASRAALAALIVFGAAASSLQAQQAQQRGGGKPSAPPGQPAAQTAQALVGAWMGTGTVQFGDSAITVPVSYTFTQGPSGIGGTALVPGQGSGTISNVTRTGSRVQFRVTVTPAAVQRATQGAAAPTEPTLLEHDGTLGADGTLEGMVNHKGQPLAKFKIAPKK